MFQRTRHLFTVGLIAGATALAASAQTPPTATSDAAANAPATAQTAPATPHAKKERDPAQRMQRMQQRHDERLAALKDKLKLESSQQSAWSSFVDAQKPPATPPQRMNRDDFAKLTTPQRLDLMQKRQAERQAEFSKRADATRSFYAALTPEQQKTFDGEAMRFGPGAPHGPGRGHGPHGSPERHGQPPADNKG